ncbi:MAG: PIN domain-containing protein [Planctomycetaceae bacterium]|nr:PIN domain-containing protein [Planctomycetaceae bacterium]
MRIYLDTCCLSRPFDAQTNERVILETEAILGIINRCQTGKDWSFFSSDVLDDEISRIPHPITKQKVLTLYHSASTHIDLNDKIVEQAKAQEQFGFRPFDSLHLACAELAKADVLLTTDKKFIQHAKRLKLKTRVVNPLIWLMEVIDEY